MRCREMGVWALLSRVDTVYPFNVSEVGEKIKLDIGLQKSVFVHSNLQESQTRHNGKLRHERILLRNGDTRYRIIRVC